MKAVHMAVRGSRSHYKRAILDISEEMLDSTDLRRSGFVASLGCLCFVTSSAGRVFTVAAGRRPG